MSDIQGGFMTQEHNCENSDQLLADRCGKHGGKVIDFFCKDHEELCCTDCVSSKHSSCNGRVTISAALQDEIHNKLPHKTLHEIDVLKVSIEKHTISKSADRQRLDIEYEQSRKRVREYRKCLNDELDRLQNEFEKELQNRYDRDVYAIENDIKASEKMTAELRDVIRKLHSSEDDKFKSFIGSMRAKELIQNLNEKLKRLSCDAWKKSLVYSIDLSLEQTIKSSKSFGTFERRDNHDYATDITETNSCFKTEEAEISQSKKTGNTVSHGGNKKENVGELMYNENREANQVADHGTYDIMKTNFEDNNENETEKENNIGHMIYDHAGIIEGMTLTESGQLILADSFNKSLKVSHIKEPEDVQTIPLKDSPRDICTINEKTLCISYKESHEVHIVALYNKRIETMHTVSLGKVCLGVFYKQGKLYVTCGKGSKAEIRLYLIDESVSHMRFCCKFPRGKKLFVSPFCVNTSNDGNEIYVGDYHEGIKALYKDGTHIWTNKGDRILKGVWGMAVDESGYIYVTGHSTNNVVKIAADGTTCGVVVDCLERPTAICYEGMTRTLLIVYDTNQLLLYKVGKDSK